MFRLNRRQEFRFCAPSALGIFINEGREEAGDFTCDRIQMLDVFQQNVPQVPPGLDRQHRKKLRVAKKCRQRIVVNKISVFEGFRYEFCEIKLRELRMFLFS
jgi:hypothetical protein